MGKSSTRILIQPNESNQPDLAKKLAKTIISLAIGVKYDR